MRRMACSEESANTTDAVSKRTNARNINVEFNENCGSRGYLMSLIVISQVFGDLLVRHVEKRKDSNLCLNSSEKPGAFVVLNHVLLSGLRLILELFGKFGRAWTA